MLKDPCAYKKLSVHENIAEKSEICVKTPKTFFLPPFWEVPFGWNDLCKVAILLTADSSFRLDSKFYSHAYSHIVISN